MGVFDYVEFVTSCPHCSAMVDDFQTKDRDNVLDRLSARGLDSFYAECESCGMWLEYRWPAESEVPELALDRMIIYYGAATRLLRSQLFDLYAYLGVRVGTIPRPK